LVPLNRGRRISRIFTFDIGVEEPLDCTQFELAGVRVPVESIAL
jgi:hypothetical protein